jgi:serine/threonine-protein kinase
MKICPHCETGFPDSALSCPTHGGLLSEIRDLKPGMLIRKTYRIVRKLGQGGMGAVYLAQHELMDAPRALKFLSAELTNDEAFTRRFLREGRTLRQVRHRNVVDCGDLERSEDETLFFAMEFVDGPDLRGLLESAAGPLQVTDALSIARGIAQGLGAAHALGLVHRDIKPENVLMARDRDGWVPKIADFGIVATVESSTIYKTTRGSLLTPPYAAPEQWRGTKASELDGRTDLYALGGVLFEMLTGQTVFDAENYEGWFYQHLEVPPRLPSSVRPELAEWKSLDALVLRLLAKNRDQRPNDVAEVLSLLVAIEHVVPLRRVTKVEEIPPEPRPVEIPIPAPHPGRITRLSPDLDSAPSKEGPKKRTRLLPEILIAALVSMVFFFSWWEGRQREEARQEAEKYSSAMAQPASAQPQNAVYQQAKTLGDNGQFKKAIPLFDQACKAGHAQACSDLGYLYDWGPHFTKEDSVTQDFPRALKLLAKSCDAGNASGCGRLATMYDSGQGVAANFSKAAELNAKACDGGLAAACNNLGVATLNGAGVPEDKEKARQLFKEGCDLGNQAACDWLKQLP